MHNNHFEAKSHRFLICVLIVIGYFLLMFGNGMVSLTHPDEVFYIQSAKEMVQYNKWFTPMIFDEVQFEKPFVAFAMFAAAIKYFGLNSAAARFWPALFGMLGVVIVYWIAWMMFNKKRTAFLSALVMTTSFIYMALSRAVLTDMIFTVIVAISIGYFYKGITEKEFQEKGIILGFIFTALAVLTKGLLGFCFPIGTLILYCLWQKNFKPLISKATLYGLGLFLVISLPWHLAMYAEHGQWFLDEYFGNVHVRRIFEAEHKRLDNWYFYFGLMFAGILPWSLFWIPAIGNVFQRFKVKSHDVSIFRYLFSWMIGVFIFVQPATSKLASYIFPLFPAIAIFIGHYLDDVLERAQEGKGIKGFRVAAYLMAFMLFAGIFIGIYFAKLYIDIVVSLKPVYITCVIVFLISLFMFLFNLRKQYLKLIFTYVTVSITLIVTIFFARPFVEPWVSCKDICDVFKKIDQSESVVIASKFYVRGVRYYTDRKMAVIDINGKGFWSPHPIPFMNTEKKVLDLLKTQKVTYAVVKEGNVEDLKRIVIGKPYRLEELDGIGGKYILRITKI